MSEDPMELILYTKPGCHLCEGLEEKLIKVSALKIQLESRNITDRPEWLAAYEYEVPVLFYKKNTQAIRLPRLSPKAPVQQLEKMLQNYYQN